MEKLNSIPEGAQWSGKEEVPAIGAAVMVKMNGIGRGIVTGYSAVPGENKNWLAIWVSVDSPPEWFRRQNRDWESRLFMFFGVDIALIEE